MKKTYQVRTDAGVVIIGPTTAEDLNSLLTSWGLIKTVKDGSRWYMCDVSRVLP